MIKTNKIYGRANRRMYKNNYRKGMDKNTYRILWTALWMIFIGSFCFICKSALPLVLLILWMIWL